MRALIYKLPLSKAPWCYALLCDYDPLFVADLKLHVPARQRKWLPVQRQWWFPSHVMDAVLSLIERHNGYVRHVDNLAPHIQMKVGKP